MHAVQSSGRVTQPARSFCDTYITARTAGNEIAPNPPFAIRHYFLHLHYHGSQALDICCARHCAFLFPVREYGPLNLGRDARSTLDSQWIRAWISIPSPIPCLLATFRPVIFLDTTVNGHLTVRIYLGLTMRPLHQPSALIVPQRLVQLATTRCQPFFYHDISHAPWLAAWSDG